MLGLLERAGDGEVDLSLVGDYLALPDTRGTGEGLMSERATGNAFGSTSCVGGVGTSVASTESSAGKDAYEKSRGLSFVGSTSIRDGERWQRTKDSRPARAGPNCTNEEGVRFAGVAHAAVIEGRGPRAEGNAGSATRRGPIGPQLCGTAERGKTGVDARSRGTSRCLTRRIRAHRGIRGTQRDGRNPRPHQNAL